MRPHISWKLVSAGEKRRRISPRRHLLRCLWRPKTTLIIYLSLSLSAFLFPLLPPLSQGRFCPRKKKKSGRRSKQSISFPFSLSPRFSFTLIFLFKMTNWLFSSEKPSIPSLYIRAESVELLRFPPRLADTTLSSWFSFDSEEGLFFFFLTSSSSSSCRSVE